MSVWVCKGRQRWLQIILIGIAGVVSSSCGLRGSNAAQRTAISLSISPTGATLQSGQLLQFKAPVKGTANTLVTWRAVRGSIDAAGLYIAPTVSKPMEDTVTVVSLATKKVATASIFILPRTTISLTISPTGATLRSGQLQQFRGPVEGTTNTLVTWRALLGSIDANGLYTAPAVSNPVKDTVTAISTAAKKIATASVFVLPRASGAGKAFPARMFSLTVNSTKDYPVLVPFGGWRGWDSSAQWPDINKCPSSMTYSQCQANPSATTFDWTRVDFHLLNVKLAGQNDVMYTLSRTPAWASPNTTDSTCDYFSMGGNNVGACYAPLDVNADGSGPNNIWRTWVRQIATHVNDPAYLQTHSHIKYWEIWNEFYRSSTITTVSAVSYSWQGTWAQMLRLLEDTRCTITGQGTVHNYPVAGQSTVCTETGIDHDAMIVAPAGSAGYPGGRQTLQNLLYCNANPKADYNQQTTCTWSGGKNWGSDAIDIVNYHSTPNRVAPEIAYTQWWPETRATLEAVDLAKPMMCGECSWGVAGKNGNIWADTYAQAGFIPRWMALLWSANIEFEEWYSWDTNDGGLWFKPHGPLNEPAATAWTNTYNWLVGAVPTTTPFCVDNGTVWTCSFSKPNGYVAQLVWDAQYGPGGRTAPTECSTATTPIICGDTSYNVPAEYANGWIDLTGVRHPYSSRVTIGANPILLEGQQ